MQSTINEKLVILKIFNLRMMLLKIINRTFFAGLFFCLMQMQTAAQIKNNYMTATHLHHLKIERSMIYTPDTAWLYNHHASVTHFKNMFIAIWSDGMKDEDKPGQRVIFATSKDFLHWSKPAILANPSVYKNDTLNVLTAAGFHQFNDTLVAYYGEYSPYKTNTHLWAKISNDGKHWSNAIDMHVASKS